MEMRKPRPIVRGPLARISDRPREKVRSTATLTAIQRMYGGSAFAAAIDARLNAEEYLLLENRKLS